MYIGDLNNHAIRYIEMGTTNIEEYEHIQISIFPNPVQNIINVKADTKIVGSNYIVYDNTGKAIQAGKIDSENTTIELGNLSDGIYMLSVGYNIRQSFTVIKL